MKISHNPVNEQQYDISPTQQPYYTPSIPVDANHNHFHFKSNNGNYECDCRNFTQAFPDMKKRCSPKAVFLQYPEAPYQDDDQTKIDPEAEINQECYKNFHKLYLQKNINENTRLETENLTNKLIPVKIFVFT